MSVLLEQIQEAYSDLCMMSKAFNLYTVSHFSFLQSTIIACAILYIGMVFIWRYMYKCNNVVVYIYVAPAHEMPRNYIDRKQLGGGCLATCLKRGCKCIVEKLLLKLPVVPRNTSIVIT